MTLVLNDAEVRAAISMPRLIETLLEGLRAEAAGRVSSVPRINLAAGSEFFRLMPVVVEDMDLMGFKVFNGSVDQGVRYMTALIRASSGELLALMDASYLTAARTGATTAVATKLMTSESDATELGVIGSGLEARTNLLALCEVRPIRRVKVFSPNPIRRAAFAAEMTEALGIGVEAVDRPQDAASAEAVLVATNTGPNSGLVALQGDWLRDDAHVSTIGSTMPALREVDGRTFARAGLVVVDTDHACEESGDVIAARDSGMWDEAKVRGLAELTAPGSRPAACLSVFKSVGTALQDVLATAAVYEVALRRGLGRDIDFLEPKLF
jgi:alanine dehydrogenase